MFIIDVVHSTQLVAKLKKYAEENDVVVRYERLKAQIRADRDRRHERSHFFQPFKSSRELGDYLAEVRSELEQRRRPKKG